MADWKGTSFNSSAAIATRDEIVLKWRQKGVSYTCLATASSSSSAEVAKLRQVLVFTPLHWKPARDPAKHNSSLDSRDCRNVRSLYVGLGQFARAVTQSGRSVFVALNYLSWRYIAISKEDDVIALGRTADVRSPRRSSSQAGTTSRLYSIGVF